MRIGIALLAALMSACSFGGAATARKPAPGVPAECRADTARDVSIAVFGLGMVGLGVAAEMHPPPEPIDGGWWLIVPGALMAITSTTSAIYGAVHGSTCQSAPPPQQSGTANAAARL